MIRRPPSSTRTDPLCPYPTLFRAKLMSLAGLNHDEDIFAPVRGAAKRRAVWLGINLLTAFLASSDVDLFQGSISKVVALAVLMPVVASMGGIGGSQTLTLMIRGLAQIGRANGRTPVNNAQL